MALEDLLDVGLLVPGDDGEERALARERLGRALEIREGRADAVLAEQQTADPILAHDPAPQRVVAIERQHPARRPRDALENFCEGVGEALEPGRGEAAAREIIVAAVEGPLASERRERLVETDHVKCCTLADPAIERILEEPREAPSRQEMSRARNHGARRRRGPGDDERRFRLTRETRIEGAQQGRQDLLELHLVIARRHGGARCHVVEQQHPKQRALLARIGERIRPVAIVAEIEPMGLAQGLPGRAAGQQE